jgi:hypothetical protein
MVEQQSRKQHEQISDREHEQTMRCRPLFGRHGVNPKAIFDG